MIIDVEVERRSEVSASIKLTVKAKRIAKKQHKLVITGKASKYGILQGSEEVFVDYVAAAGIVVPTDLEVAIINLSRRSEINDLSRFVRRDDEQLGTVFTKQEELSAAVNRVYAVLEELERHEIDIKQAFPQARTNKKGPVTVSLTGLDYFHRYAYQRGTELPTIYHSLRSEKTPPIRFIPADIIQLSKR